MIRKLTFSNSYQPNNAGPADVKKWIDAQLQHCKDNSLSADVVAVPVVNTRGSSYNPIYIYFVLGHTVTDPPLPV